MLGEQHDPAPNTRLRPIRSPARPPNSMKPPKISVYMLTTHCRLDGLNRRPRWIDGSATLTIVASRTTMNWATQTMTTTSHGSPAPLARPPVAADLSRWTMTPTTLTTAALGVHGRGVDVAAVLRNQAVPEPEHVAAGKGDLAPVEAGGVAVALCD